MKIIKCILFVPLLILLYTSCSDDSNDSGGLNPLAPGGSSNTSSVSFTISTVQGNQGVIFVATPNVAVKLTKVTVSLPAQSYTDVLTDDGTYVYNANEGIQIEEYVGVASGQQWTFQFEGSTASNNQAFNVTSNYTVP